MSGKHFALERETAGSVQGIVHSKQGEILQLEDANVQTPRGQGKISCLLSTESKPRQVSSWRGGLQCSGLSPPLSFSICYRCAALAPNCPICPPPGQPPSRSQINLDAGLALSLATDVQLNPTFQNDLCTHLCNCLTCATNNTWNWKRSWVIFLAVLITLLYWHQLVLYWSTPSGPKSNLLFAVYYLPAVYFQYFSELVEWEKAALLHF